MLHSTLYSLLLLPAFLLHTANASIRWDSISTVTYPKYYAVHNGKDTVGDQVEFAQKTDSDSAPSGSNLVVYQNGSISNPNGDLFVGADSNYTMIIWDSKPLSWNILQLDSGFSLYHALEDDINIVCWHHIVPTSDVFDLKVCPFKGDADVSEYTWAWD